MPRLATAAVVVVCSVVCAKAARAQTVVTFNHRAASAGTVSDVIAERVFKPAHEKFKKPLGLDVPPEGEASPSRR